MGQTEQKARNGFLDALKGFSILLVVVGHAIQTVPNFDDNILFRIIYSFHMPLFMFLSGVVAACSLKPMNWQFIRNKALTLVVPFIAWYIITYLVSGAYQTTPVWAFFGRLALAPDVGLWFLWILFLDFCMLALVKNLQRHIGTASFLAVWLGIQLLPEVSWLGLPLLKWHLTFFLAGYIVWFYRDKLHGYYKPAVITSAAIFLLGIYFWRRVGDPAFAGKLHAVLTRFNINQFYPTLLLMYHYAMPFAGIGLVTWGVMRLARNKYAYATLAWLGVYTLDIYVSHQYFFPYAVGQGVLHYVSAAVVALGCSLLLSFLVLRRSAVLSRVLLGGRGSSWGWGIRRRISWMWTKLVRRQSQVVTSNELS
ncbi:MAG TPA: acyltransferase family protein [Candidatus Saccharimonadales bacterium]|nr:acyltransferase family protein [Candidatus Saccharimonadales bacterium]